MITLGELKTNIIKILQEYSKNGELLTSDVPSLADKLLLMDFHIDTAHRIVKTVCGLDCSRVFIAAEENEDVSFALPEDHAATELLLTPSNELYCGCAYIADSKLCFKATLGGDYVLVYKHYPHSISGKEDSYELELDPLLADAVAYCAACELCDKLDGELYTRIKHRFDEIIANRYNVDKLSAPPFNRVYGAKRWRNVI